MREMILLASVLGVGLLTGCAGSQSSASAAWFAEQEAAIEDSYPSLQSVPRESDANVDAAHWARMQAELVAAGRAVRASPRAQPATAADDPQAFLDAARGEIEAARLAHEPN